MLKINNSNVLYTTKKGKAIKRIIKSKKTVYPTKEMLDIKLSYDGDVVEEGKFIGINAISTNANFPETEIGVKPTIVDTYDYLEIGSSRNYSSAYFITDYYPNPKTEIRSKFQTGYLYSGSNSPSYHCVYGCRYGPNNSAFLIYMIYNGYRSWWYYNFFTAMAGSADKDVFFYINGNSANSSSASQVNTVIHKYGYMKFSNSYGTTESELNSASLTGRIPYPLYIGANDLNGSWHEGNFNCKYYEFEIWEDGELMRKYVPTLNKEGLPIFYELVTKTELVPKNPTYCKLSTTHTVKEYNISSYTCELKDDKVKFTVNNNNTGVIQALIDAWSKYNENIGTKASVNVNCIGLDRIDYYPGVKTVYTEPYLTMDGKTYFDTGILLTKDDTIEMKFTYNPKGNGDWMGLYGQMNSYSDVDSTCWYLARNGTSNNLTLRLNGVNNIANFNVTLGGTYIIKQNLQLLQVDGDLKYIANLNRTSYTPPTTGYRQTLCLYRSWNTGLGGNFYYFKIYRNEELIHNYVPYSNESIIDTVTNEIIQASHFTDIVCVKNLTIDNTIPEEYTLLDYIESTGSSYIDTGLMIKGYLSHSIVADVNFTENSTRENVVASNWIGGDNYVDNSLARNNSKAYYYYKNGSISSTDTLPINTWTTITGSVDLLLGKRKVSFDNSDTLSEASNDISEATESRRSLLLFYRGDLNYNYRGVFKARKFIIYLDEICAMYLVPCKENETEEIGLFDLISRTFFTNLGDSSFLYEELETPSTEVSITNTEITSYLRFIGKPNWFNLDFTPKSNHIYELQVMPKNITNSLNEFLNSCAGSESNTSKLELWIDGGYWKLYANGTTYNHSVTPVIDTLYTVKIGNNKFTINGTDVSIGALKDSDATMKIAGNFIDDNWENLSWFPLCLFYYLKVSDTSGLLLHNYIPYDNNTLFDSVTNKYITINDKSYYEVEKIETLYLTPFLYKDDVVNMSLDLIPENSTKKDSVYYEVSNNNYASIDKNGNITILTTGILNITASAKSSVASSLSSSYSFILNDEVIIQGINEEKVNTYFPNLTTTLYYKGVGNKYEISKSLVASLGNISSWFLNNWSIKDLTAFKYFEGITNTESLCYNCVNLTTATIPSSLTTLNNNIFRGCTKLVSVLFNLANILSLGDNAFYGDVKLENATLPDSITSIGADCFRGCTLLSLQDLPANIVTIGTRAFYQSNCNFSYLPDTVTTLPDPGNLEYWYGNQTNELWNSYVYARCGEFDTNIYLYNSNQIIGHGAFANRSNLLEVSLNTSKSIGSYAFYNDANLSTVYEVRGSIGAGAFRNCPKLQTIYFLDADSNKYTIGSEAFRDSFRTCENDVEIVIPENYTSLGSLAFYGCTKVTSVTLSSKITTINDGTFNGTSIVKAEFPYITTITGGSTTIFPTSMTELSLPSIKVLSGRLRWYSGEFKVILGKDIKQIDGSVWVDTGFTYVLIKNLVSIPTLGTTQRDGVYYVPNHLYELYQTASSNWTTIYNAGRLKTWTLFIEDYPNDAETYDINANVSNISFNKTITELGQTNKVTLSVYSDGITDIEWTVNDKGTITSTTGYSTLLLPSSTALIGDKIILTATSTENSDVLVTMEITVIETLGDLILEDGSVWRMLLNHLLPASNLFLKASAGNYGNDITDTLYSRLDTITTESKFNGLYYEFLAILKPTSTSTETYIRWRLDNNPATDSSISNFVNISNAERGIRRLGSETYICSNNGWWDAYGSWSSYQGGIPGAKGLVVTTGYLQLYIREQ